MEASTTAMDYGLIRFADFCMNVIEPTETELAERVEYDMDEQGKAISNFQG